MTSSFWHCPKPLHRVALPKVFIRKSGAVLWARTKDCISRVSLELGCSFSEFNTSRMPCGEAGNSQILPPTGRSQFCRLPSGDGARGWVFPLEEGAPGCTVYVTSWKTPFPPLQAPIRSVSVPGMSP